MTQTRRADREGFTLVEIMIAMTILAITLGGFAALTFQYVRRVETATGTVSKTAAMNEQVQRLTVLSYDSLAARAGCTTVNGTFPYTRCITLTDVASKHKRVTIIITPANTLVKPDTIILDRTKTPTSNPLHP